jgi:stress response protein SCP2
MKYFRNIPFLFSGLRRSTEQDTKQNHREEMSSFAGVDFDASAVLFSDTGRLIEAVYFDNLRNGNG